MDQDNPIRSQTQEDNPNGAAEASTTAPASDTVAPDTSAQPAAPSRPRRPQRCAKVEGSVDITEPRAEPADEPAPVANREASTPDGIAASRPKPSRSAAGKPLGERTGPSMKAGPKGPGHHPMRAASVPDPHVSRPVPSHLNLHAQRALSVAGTADTQAQTVEDFRQVLWSVCVPTFMSQHVYMLLLVPRQSEKDSQHFRAAWVFWKHVSKLWWLTLCSWLFKPVVLPALSRRRFMFCNMIHFGAETFPFQLQKGDMFSPWWPVKGLCLSFPLDVPLFLKGVSNCSFVL